ncbi:MAG TPA: DUF4258 domain-containing protein [Candidatus Nanoarchaeia archaeon]|nr:DUF4258 domain-containing protein [Candidatus Nanoarchaeia archaeon]
MYIQYSKHARSQMIARGISENEVNEAIKSGSKHIQHPDKIVSDYKYFSLVYKKIGENIFVITVKLRW